MSDKSDQYLNHLKVEITAIEAAARAAADDLKAQVAAKDKQIAELSKPAPEPAQPTTPPVTPPAASDPQYKNTITLDASNASGKSIGGNTLVLIANGDVLLAKPININGSNVCVRGIGPKSRLVDNDPATANDDLKCLIGTAAVSNIVIENLRFYSPDGNINHQANGVNVSGKNVTIRNCKFDACLNGVLATSKCDTVNIADNEFHSSYGVYVQGANVTIDSNNANQCVHAFVRTNGFKNLTIINNTLVGNPDATKTEPSRITIQKGDGFRIEGNTLTNTSISAYPLSSGTALRGEKTVANVQAARTKNGKILNNTIKGEGGIVIGNRTENVTYVGQPEPKVATNPETLDCEGTMIPVVPAKGVTVNGKVVA